LREAIYESSYVLEMLLVDVRKIGKPMCCLAEIEQLYRDFSLQTQNKEIEGLKPFFFPSSVTSNLAL